MKEVLVTVKNNWSAIQELQQSIEMLLGIMNTEQSTALPRVEAPPELPTICITIVTSKFC